MKIINKRIYTDKQYIELLEDRIKEIIKAINEDIYFKYPEDREELLYILRGKTNDKN